MRTLRKLFLYTTMALATTMLAASAASASVEVRDADGEYCGQDDNCVITIDGKLEARNAPPGSGLSYATCDDVSVTITVTEYGELLANTIEADGYGNQWTQGCYQPNTDIGYFDDCGDYGWSGQILGPGDSYGNVSYSGLNDYDAVLTTCFEGNPNSIDNYYATIRFGLDAPDSPTGQLNWTFDDQYHHIRYLVGDNWDGPATAELQIEDI
jgi:hypothetical protein